MHKPHWAVSNPPYDKILTQSNCAPCLELSDSFTKEISPRLRMLAPRPVYLIAGDVGAQWAVPFFFHKDENDNLTYIATGLGDSKRDVALRVVITQEGEAHFSLLPLGKTTDTHLEAYGFEQLFKNHWMFF